MTWETEWDTITGTGISQKSPGMAGTLAMLRIQITDTSSRICSKSFSPTTDYLRYRFYVDVTGLTMAAGDEFIIHQIHLTGGIPTLFAIALAYDGSNYTLIPRVWSDGGASTDGSSIEITSGEEHWIEIYIRNANTGLSDGACAVYLDNEYATVLVGLDIDSLWANMSAFRLGAIEGLDAGTSGNLYFDEVLVTYSDRPIGPHLFNRLESKAFDYELRFFVGPRVDYVDLTEFSFGGAFDTSVETTLAADMDYTDGTVDLVDASGFRASGAVLIEANAAGEVDEFITYESKSINTLSGVKRDFSATGQQGVHTIGATVKQWIDVTSYITGCSLGWSRQGNVIVWEANLPGQNYNRSYFQRDNTIMAQVRFSPAGESGGWTDWVVLFFGSITNKNVRDDYKQGGEFTLKVEGPQAYLRSKSIDSHRFGRNNLAENRPVTVSSTLLDVRQEADSGEFTGAPSVEGANLVDGNLSTLWISQTVPDVTQESRPTGSFYARISEIYPRHLIGYNHADYQWFEIVIGDYAEELGIDYNSLFRYFFTSLTGWPGIELMRTDTGGVKAGDIVLVCSNRKKFEEAFATAKYHKIIDARRQLFNTNGDWMALARSVSWHQYDTGWGTHCNDAVVFGSASYPVDWPDPGVAGEDPRWSGAAIPLPDYGHSLRRSPTMTTDTGTAADWIEDEYPLPGRHESANGEWASVELPAMTATLAAQLDAGYTTDAELTNLDGLTESGRVQIDIEWIDYASLDRANNKIVGLTRGVGDTTDATHAASTPVYQVENGVATNTLRISSVAWRRRTVYNSTTLVVPEDFSIWVTEEESPNYPSTGLPGSEWTRVAVAHAWTDTEFVQQFSPVRARHVMVFIREMSDGGRAKLNEFDVYEAVTTISDDENTAEYSDTGAIVKHVLKTHVGLDANKLTINDVVPFLNWTTAKSNVLALLDDLGKKTSCALVCELDGSLTWEHDPLYPLYTLPDIAIEFGRNTAIQVSPQWSHGRETAQIIVHARDAESSRQFTGQYPPSPATIGDTQVVEDVIAGSAREAQFLAEIMYRQARSALQLTVEASGTGEDPSGLPLLRPGSRVTLDWELDQTGEEFHGRNFIITGAHVNAEFGKPGEDGKKWDVSFQAQELIF
jgi:hypothetical protein